MDVSPELIFVSIASYRDPELWPTLEDCLAKASFPERLRFGVCWQHDSDERAPDLLADSRFRVVDVDWRESRGACWARAEIMKLWEGEEWFLQLDSHHRFARDWDVALLGQAAATGSPKPVLTTYATPFTPGDAPEGLSDEPMLMQFDRFTDEAIVLFRPGGIPNWQTRTGPVRSRFLSAHFLFAPGSFVTDVPYDPDLYFIGEEITLAVRAFTHGYDLFHPSQVIVWHEYTRNYRTKHWDDHTSRNGVELDWSLRDASSRDKVRRFLAEPHIGSFGCGTDRTIAEYETYAGLSFAHRRSQDYTRYYFEPPNPPIDADWAERTQIHRIELAFDARRLTRAAREDPLFWYVGFEDSDGVEIFRQDADRSELRRLLNDDPPVIRLVREFESTVEPASWTVWWCGALGEWIDEEKITGPIIPTGPICDADGEVVESWATVAALGVEPASTVGGGVVLASPVTPRRRRAMAAGGGTRAVSAGWGDAGDRFPRTAPGLTWFEIDGVFTVTLAANPESRFVLNSTGVLLLELANGRYSLAEITGVVSDAYGLSQPPEHEIAEFFESASRRGLILNDTIGTEGKAHE